MSKETPGKYTVLAYASRATDDIESGAKALRYGEYFFDRAVHIMCAYLTDGYQRFAEISAPLGYATVTNEDGLTLAEGFREDGGTVRWFNHLTKEWRTYHEESF